MYFYCMISFLQTYQSWIWVALAIVFSLVEISTMALTTIWFAIGAVILALLTFFPIPLHIQLLIFLLISIVTMALFRRMALDWFEKRREKTNVNALIGSTCIVTKAITPFEKGEIKINGTIWTAVSAPQTGAGTSGDGMASIDAGTVCTITEINGCTASVVPTPKDEA